MDRATVTLGTENGDSRIVDRRADRWPGSGDEGAGDSPCGTSRADAVLPGSAACLPTGAAGPGAQEEQEVALPEVGSQLPVPERQRFGHCFSFMVLKALGLRPCPAAEVES